jgi:uncharacterized membrane protein YtjA (UPF0391 family)
MLQYALIFFVIAILAANLGFGRAAAASEGIGKILSLLFLIAFVMIINAGRRV